MRKSITLLFSIITTLSFATNHQVSVGSNFFNPSSLTVNVGDTVTWANTGGTHNVDGRTVTYASNPASFYSGSASSASWSFSFTFTVAGTYNYECTPHASLGMTGTVIVNAPKPLYTIAQVTGLDSNGEPDSITVECALRGTVTSVDYDGNSGYSFYIHDGTGGINIYNFADVNNYAVTMGDSLYVEGEIDQYNGLTELFVDSISVISTGNTVKMPTVVSSLGESTESDLIQINNLTIVDPTDWTNSGSGFNVDVTNGIDTMTMRIDADVNIYGTSAPAGTFDLVGIGSQFDFSSPYFDGYQILPRSLSDIMLQSSYSVYTIASVTTIDANGEADSLNQPANLAGTVTSVDYDGNSGYSFYIHDGTGGINIYNFADVDNYVVTIGDSIYVEGDIDQYNGLTELFVDSISVISTGNTVKMPTVVSSLGENTESDLIRINNLTIIDTSDWTNSGSGFNVDVTNGTDTMTMRIDADVNIYGTTVPTGTFDLIGIGSQFDFSSPYFDGYQILPRMLTDIIPASSSTGCNEVFFSEYMEGSSSNKALEVYNPSNAPINMSVYSISIYNNGNTTPSNTFNFPNMMLDSNDTYVIANPGAIPSILSKADTTSSVTFFNGDDAVVLFKNSDTLDIIGVVGVDPGSGWTVGSGSTANRTLVRQVAVNEGTTDWTVSQNQWDVYSSNTDTYLGYHVSVCHGGTPPPPSGTPMYAISDLTSVDTNGVADSISVYGIIEGYVSGGNLRSGGVEFWLIDTINTDGLLVRNTGYNNYTVTEGDKLWVRGSVSQFNGLIQFVPDSINVLSSGNMLPTAAPVAALGESTEGRLIVMNNMTVVSGWPNPGSSGNVVISDGNSTFTMRIDSDTHITDSITTAPSGLVNIYGHGGQYDASSPYTSGYQINPRYFTDIEPVVVTSPTINFPSPAQTVSEGVGTVLITLPINPVSSSAEMVKLYLVEGSGITSGDYSTMPAAVNDTLTLSVAAGDSAQFSVTVNDDLIQENDETLTFSIASVTSGLTVGPVATHVLTISDNDVFIPTYDISDVKGLDANFEPDSSGVMCKIEGVVLGVDMQGTASANISFTVHNGSVGFGVFMPNSTYTVAEGDSVRVIGTVGQFNGLAQMNADSVTYINAGNALPMPKAITALGEVTESDLNIFYNAEVIDPTQWTNSGSGFNVDVTDGTDTIVLRVDKDVDLFSQPAPIGKFNVIGIGGQYDNSSPYNSGYQMLPRYIADVIPVAPTSYPLAITEIMPGSNDPDPDVNDDWFELTNYGTSAINLTGFSFDDESEIPGTVIFPNISIPAGESFVIWRGVSANESAFKDAWGLQNTNVEILSSDELAGSFPGLGQSGDAVVLYDTSANPIEICNAVYSSATAGFSVEFDTNCVALGNAQVGVRGAYTSNGGDVGSPGNKNVIGIDENALNVLRAYPNPVADILNIDMKGGAKTVSMVSITGAVLYYNKTSEAKLRVDMSNYAAGVYFVKVEQNGNSKVTKVVKR